MSTSTPAIFTRRPGTYALILFARAPCQMAVERWGTLDFLPGYYVYVGSASGPGGVSARSQRHCRQRKKLSWHIDYLCEVTTPVKAWCGFGGRDLEHGWAGIFVCRKIFSRGGGLTAIPGFGCSNCRCVSHLFATDAAPDPQLFGVVAGMQPAVWSLPNIGEA